MNFAMLPKYYISKILSSIFAHKQSVWKPKLLFHLWLVNANSLYCALQRTAFLLHQVMHNIQTTQQSAQ